MKRIFGIFLCFALSIMAGYTGVQAADRTAPPPDIRIAVTDMDACTAIVAADYVLESVQVAVLCHFAGKDPYFAHTVMMLELHVEFIRIAKPYLWPGLYCNYTNTPYRPPLTYSRRNAKPFH